MTQMQPKTPLQDITEVTDIQAVEKKAKRLGMIRNIKGGICMSAVATTMWAGSNADKTDDFLILPSAGVAIVSAGLIGMTHAKKEEKEVEIAKVTGQPPKTWWNVAKYACISGLLSLGISAFCALNDAKEDTGWLIGSSLASVASFALLGYAGCRHYQNKKLFCYDNVSSSVEKQDEKCLSDSKFNRIIKSIKNSLMPYKKKPSVRKQMLLGATIMWHSVLNIKPEYSFQKDFMPRQINPRRIVKSTLPCCVNMVNKRVYA